MKLHTALDDFKRTRGDPRRFPGERRSVEGLFSGFDGRLVHVEPDGSIRDYSDPLSGFGGIERSRFGVAVDGTVEWFDDGPQRYVDGTAVVETVHSVADGTVRTLDATFGRRHLTHVRLDESRAASIDGNPTLHACFEFAPDGRSGRVGQLRHDGAVEVFHDRERAVVTASTPMDATGVLPERFEEILADEPTTFPRPAEAGRYEEEQLSPILHARVDLVGDPPSATVVSALSGPNADRTEALRRARTAADEHGTGRALLETGRERADERLSDAGPDGALADLRALWLLRAPTGARIAGPEFDPFYRHSGGYGYTWFRDDAEIARFLLEADRAVDLGLDAWHADSARFYAETQRADGTWPHRVWARNGRLAPGWAHGRVEGADGARAADYQADQTASVATFLATYLRLVAPENEAVRESCADALEGIEATTAADGLPDRCQNAWENMLGRFAHTAATVLEAYAALARAPLDEPLRERARERARSVYEALDELWLEDRGRYAMRIEGGELDGRADGSTLALATAHRQYDALEGVDERRLDRLASHVEATIEELFRDPDGPVRGLARFEGDPWRRRGQDDPKIWTVTTAWGAHAALTLRDLCSTHDRADADRFDEWGRELHALVAPEGALRTAGGYFPEQVFDDGTPDSARPLGWPHAIRLATACRLA